MKSSLLLSAVLFSIAVVGCGPQTTETPDTMTVTEDDPTTSEHAANPIVGAWELIHGTYGLPDEPSERNQPDNPFQLKLFTESGHFAYVMKDAEGAYSSASGGTYSLDGSTYTETHSWSSGGDTLTASWEFRVAGDTLYMSGPVSIFDATGVAMADYSTMEEIRVRAQASE